MIPLSFDLFLMIMNAERRIIMRKSLFFGAGKSLFQATENAGKWTITERETSHELQCLAVDPEAGRLYAGTFDDGLWLSDDQGKTWQKGGEGIHHDRVLSVAVSPVEKNHGYGVVWAGTEPSALFRSEDGGRNWTELPSLLELPSEPSWSFPPRPHTHHVRYIQPDIHAENRIYVGIELGGVMKSEDRGETWEDRKEGSQFDCHTLTMNQLARDRVYEAGGGGFAESLDGGNTWKTRNDGLGPYTYLVEMAVDAGDPDTIIVSGARGPGSAYDPARASTVLFRREKNHDWELITDGLPDPEGSTVLTLASDENIPGHFYAVNNTGLYQSVDSGKSWSRLPLSWPRHVMKERVRFLILDQTH